jgi:hypothetical protein
MNKKALSACCCPACRETLVFPRDSYYYCEECGWPDEDFCEKYAYPKEGEKLESFQPFLEFYNGFVWVSSGIISGVVRGNNFKGMYRYPLNLFNNREI